MRGDKLDYRGTVFGDLLVPYFELHENLKEPYKEKDVVITKTPTHFEIPDLKVRSFKEKLAEAKKLDAEKNGRKYFDNPATRLVNYSVDDDNHKLCLELQETTYSTFSATNKSVDNVEVKRMIEERGASYDNLDDGLANAIGVNVNLFSIPDNSIVIMERSMNSDQYPGLFGIPAGFFNPVKHNYNPFNTGRMEVEEEVGVPVEELLMFGLGRALDDRHTEILMTAKTPYTKEQILSAPKTSRWEGKIKPENIMSFEPEKIMKLLTKTIHEEPKGIPRDTGAWVVDRSPSWVGAHWKAISDQLIYEFGFDEVWNAYEETRRNS
jgi:hypothetical protein